VEVTREDKIRNKCVRGSIGVTSIVDKVGGNRLKWSGHAMRRGETDPVRKGIRMNVEGRRGRSKQR